MHVSYYANPAIQASKEEHIIQMYELMAATGKLVRITELDMGYVDENGTSVQTKQMTEAQHKAMGEFYKFIIQNILKSYQPTSGMVLHTGVRQTAPKLLLERW